MTKINSISEYEETIKKENVVIIFTQIPCGLCRAYLKSLHKYNTTRFFELPIDNTMQEYYHYRKHAKLKMLYPITRIYNNSEIIHEEMGVLYETQINKILELLKV